MSLGLQVIERAVKEGSLVLPEGCAPGKFAAEVSDLLESGKSVGREGTLFLPCETPTPVRVVRITTDNLPFLRTNRVSFTGAAREILSGPSETPVSLDQLDQWFVGLTPPMATWLAFGLTADTRKVDRQMPDRVKTGTYSISSIVATLEGYPAQFPPKPQELLTMMVCNALSGHCNLGISRWEGSDWLQKYAASSRFWAEHAEIRNDSHPA